MFSITRLNSLCTTGDGYFLEQKKLRKLDVKKTRYCSKKHLEIKHEATECGDNVRQNLLSCIVTGLGGYLEKQTIIIFNHIPAAHELIPVVKYRR
jgi:hypothetical protein